MTIVFGLAIFFIIWWLVLFTVLPFGVRTQAEAGEIVPGTPESAPVQTRMLRVFAITTLIATVVFAFVWWVAVAPAGKGAIDWFFESTFGMTIFRGQ
ncbi:MAG: hypothetical protein RLZ98_2816 [Pseudomonadota bacterium]|jgi:predicted secreted protein